MTGKALLGLLAAWSAGTALACGDNLGSGTRRLENPQFLLVYKLLPDPVPVGRHFSIDFALCARAQAPLPGEVRVDAQMPEHKHGMNYRPSVSPRGPGQYRAEGLMFHMPGHWELSFELRSPGAAPLRLSQSLQVG
jgi:hypothetical protein